jgi:hypothetical protein
VTGGVPEVQDRGHALLLDWITLVVMVIVFIVGAVLFLLARGGRELDEHLRDDAEKPAASRQPRREHSAEAEGS